MITYLKVRNLAIVEEFSIEPSTGLNVLTGETGAGKSLLIDSLELLRGRRGSTELIRAGCDRMSAEAVFHLPPAAAESLESVGVEVERQQAHVELIVKREIGTGGRSRVLMNGSPFAVRELAEAMDAVLDIHGQNETHERVAGRSFRELLDAFGGHEALLDATRATHSTWSAAASQLRDLEQVQQDRGTRIDLLTWQIREIDEASLEPGEEEKLRSDRAILSRAHELAEATRGAIDLLEEDEMAAGDRIARAAHLLQPLANDISAVAPVVEELHDLRYRLQESARSLRDLADGVRDDPARIEEIEQRLVTLERLNRKYGGSVEAVLAHRAASSHDLEQLTDFESTIERLRRAEAAKWDEYAAAAGRLSAARVASAKRFEKAIRLQLDDLAMEGTSVVIPVEPAEKRDGRPVAFGPTGTDRIEILIAPNRGEEPKPVGRIASGGELSRIQLAIAAALFQATPRAAAATLVFDEVDAGIGGRVAEVVGRKLHELSSSNQVICVTHLPQIASFGETHFVVWKEESNGQTRARIRLLDSDELRVDEIARMLGGERVTASAKVHARELLESARKGADRADPVRSHSRRS